MAFSLLLALPSLGQQKPVQPEHDDEIIVIDEEIVKTPAEKIFATESQDENFVVGADLRLQFSLRPVSSDVLGFPSLGFANLSAGFQVFPELYFQLSALGRVPVRTQAPHFDAFADLDDSHMKLQYDDFVFSLGYLRIPWRVLRGAALNDRLNPIDYRVGDDFPKDSEGRVPQWGMQFKSSLLGWSAEADYLFWYRPSQGSFVMSDQNGVQIGHYQGALASTMQELSQLVPGSKPIDFEALPWFLSPSLAFRARRNIGDVDVGINVVWGYDEVPALQLLPTQTLLSSRRAVSFGGDLSWTLGVVLIKAEAVVTPKLAKDIGKVTLLRSPDGLSTQLLSNAALGLGVDGEYGDWLSGSLEIIDSIWLNVPGGSSVHGVEPFNAQASAQHTVHRAAIAFALNGAIFSDLVSWNFRGETGINNPDILAKLDLRRDFFNTGLYVGAYATVFYGVHESPGWYRRSATQFGALIGYHL